jgi:hypothetical protein
VVVRIIQLPSASPLEAYYQRVALLARDRSVLIVACRQPLAMMRPELSSAGVNLDHVFVADVVTDQLSVKHRDPEHELFLHNPSLLELIARRVDLIVKAKAARPSSVIVDDVPSFLAHAAPQDLVQVVRYARSLLRQGNEQEYIVNHTGIPDSLRAAGIMDAVDEVRRLRPDGTLDDETVR